MSRNQVGKIKRFKKVCALRVTLELETHPEEEIYLLNPHPRICLLFLERETPIGCCLPYPPQAGIEPTTLLGYGRRSNEPAGQDALYFMTLLVLQIYAFRKAVQEENACPSVGSCVFYKPPFSSHFSIISKFSAISICKFYKTKTNLVF